MLTILGVVIRKVTSSVSFAIDSAFGTFQAPTQGGDLVAVDA